jgi:hypothetical protein
VPVAEGLSQIHRIPIPIHPAESEPGKIPDEIDLVLTSSETVALCLTISGWSEA